MTMVAVTKETRGRKRVRYSGTEAAVLLEEWFRWRAARIARENRSLVDDMVQEMSMSVALCRHDHRLAFYKRRALSRARDLLRREKAMARKAQRYGLLSRPIMEDDDTPFIEGMIDLENALSSRRHEREDVVDMCVPVRASA
jgi:hypothetical protein